MVEEAIKQWINIEMEKMLTLDDTLKITQIVHDANKIPQDITRFADAKRWSESNGCFMRYGDMPLHYLIRALLKDGGKQWV